MSKPFVLPRLLVNGIAVVALLAGALPALAQLPEAPRPPAARPAGAPPVAAPANEVPAPGLAELQEQIESLKKDYQAARQEVQQAKTQAQETAAALAEVTAAQAEMTAKVAAASAEVAAAESKSVVELVAKATKTEGQLNMVWVLVAGILVMFMQAGFAMVESGFTRAKNCSHTVCMNLMDYCIALLGFWAVGFALMFGGSGAGTSMGADASALGSLLKIPLFGEEWGVLGYAGFFLTGEGMYTGAIFTFFFFQAMFMNTATTIPTGTLAERWKFSAFAINSLLVGILIYPVFGCWVWGGGWLFQLGYTDFAGSSVVHLTGAVIALIGAIVVGPRQGKFNKNGTPNPIPGHNIPMAYLGTFILAFGWFGFNAGSTLSGADPQIGIIAVNTALASAAGAVAAMAITSMRFGKPDPSFMANGMLGGLVGITAPCAFVDAWAAVVIGALAGVLVVYGATLIEEVVKLDDPVGAISVHGICGIWGVLSVGIFGNGIYVAGVKGILFSPDAAGLKFFLVQCLGVVTCLAWVGVTSYIVYQIIEAIVGNRPDPADELAGLDIPETGVLGYQADLNPESK